MRIGVDLQVLGQKNLTGVSNYALNISRGLLELNTNDEFIFFIPDTSVIPDLIGDPDLPSTSSRGLDSRFPPAWTSSKRSRAGRGNDKINIVMLPRKRIPFLTAHWRYARIMQKAKLDVLFSPANTTPWFYSGKTVVTIHDLAIYKHPEWFPKGQGFSVKYLVPRSIKRATKIIVPSKATKTDLISLFEIPEKKIEIIPHGVEERFFAHLGSRDSITRLQSDKSRKYILFVGTIEPRKNVQRLIEAYEILPPDIKDKYELWIAGEKGWGLETEKLKVKNEKLEGIRLLGYVPDEELPALYSGAKVFVYPSFYEGFGLPVLEAMAAGVPVVASNTSSLPEVVGAAGVLADPNSTHSIAEAIAKLIRDSAHLSQISKLGRERARQFTWRRCAQLTLSAIGNSLRTRL